MLADIARQIAQDATQALESAKETAKAQAPLNSQQLQTFLQSALRKCDLVTREEFDAQAAVLLRTREKLEALEKQIDALESNTNKTAPGMTPPNE